MSKCCRSGGSWNANLCAPCGGVAPCMIGPPPPHVHDEDYDSLGGCCRVGELACQVNKRPLAGAREADLDDQHRRFAAAGGLEHEARLEVFPLGNDYPAIFSCPNGGL